MEVMNYEVLHCNFSFKNQVIGRGGTNGGRQDNTMYKTVTNDQMETEKCVSSSLMSVHHGKPQQPAPIAV